MRHVLALLLLAAPAHAMTIVPTWDSSVTSNANKAGIEAAFTAAALAYTSQFTNPVTIKIQVGFGEDGGSTMPGGEAGESNSGIDCCWSYSQITAALPGLHSPANSPAAGDWFGMPWAEAQAVGLAPATGQIYAGSLGVSSHLKYTFTGTVAPGTYSAVGIFEHEIAEILGRNSTIYSDGQDGFWDQPFDLLRYTAPGVQDVYGITDATYVSIDGGITNLGAGNPPSNGGDANDWLHVAGDVQNAMASTGPESVSQADLAILGALGWQKTGHADSVPIHEPPVWTLLGSFFAIIFLARRLDRKKD